MSLYHTFCLLIALSALFAFINSKYLRLPASVGLMLIAVVSSLALVVVGRLFPSVLGDATSLIQKFDFSELLLNCLLSFMLFASAININIEDLRKEKLPVIFFSTFSVVLSTFVVGTLAYFVLPLFHFSVPYLHCLLFGALISPTDPIAVLGILRDIKVPKSIETKISGESLFNDGVAVVIFVSIWRAAKSPHLPQFSDIALLFLKEAIGGLLLGFALGWIGYRLIRSINDYKVEVMITIAVVMGGYTLASLIGLSGPLAMGVAGIFLGNHAKKYAMSDKSTEYLYKFWELIDDILNAMLFVLIGLQLLLIKSIGDYLLISMVMVLIILCGRFISVFVPSFIIRFSEKFQRKTLLILTWGGLRGGVSIALALSLTYDLNKDLWVSVTYFVVAFSILVQGLTIERLTKGLKV
ncbi:sodium:proton antiporter [Pelobium manganitolerans]|uniref:Sodium:proton antiporter n=1 Tax=Pelobium manganitolerans TaxID=1842495 RepID=A0A419S4N7_9SPHI|nr:sodium:proton antiporter [Pelobium manganitolerans]RKD15043.1 sodium:proton antiporter [Pelobium manganitolerans]